MALISFAVTAKLLCAFVFAYADCWFCHVAAYKFWNAQTESDIRNNMYSKLFVNIEELKSYSEDAFSVGFYVTQINKQCSGLVPFYATPPICVA